MTDLEKLFDSEKDAQQVLREQEKLRDKERRRIRAKFSKFDRDFLDSIISKFPGARMVAVKFSDGESRGEML